MGLKRTVAYSGLQREIGPARAGLIIDLMPVYNAGWAWMGFDEAVPEYHVAGAALVVGGFLANRPDSATP